MEAFGWYKETLIFLKGNKVFLLLVTAALGSGSTAIVQTMEATAQKAQKIIAIHEVTKGFQQVMIDMDKTPQKTLQKKTNCGKCSKEISEIKEDIKKLKRWH
ncbi:MAG: hypothetical protein V3T88_02770 [Nitrosomonadaceae bacterium]